MKKLIFTIIYMIFFLTITSSTVYALDVTCNSCSDCTSKLNGLYTHIKLIQDISVPSGVDPCINFGADNIVFDCDEHKIINNQDRNLIGINAENRNEITIENCVLEGHFYSAILLFRTNHSKFINNNIYFAKEGIAGYGIALSYSNYNEIRNNVILDSDAVGIYAILESNNNIISNNIVKRANHYGICSCLDVSGNVMENNSVVYSGTGPDGGICLCGNSIKNILNNNYACFNNNTDFHVCTDSVCNGIGHNNVCNKPYNWNDVGQSGCTYPCICMTNPFGTSADGRCHEECGAAEECDNLLPDSGCCYRCFDTDINDDKHVNILDAIQLSSAFGSKPGYPKWNPSADINKDNKVNILDSIAFGQKFGASC